LQTRIFVEIKSNRNISCQILKYTTKAIFEGKYKSLKYSCLEEGLNYKHTESAET
jgi:hypothetical protein